MEITPLTAEQQTVVDASFNKRFAELNAKAEVSKNEAVAIAEAKYREQFAKLEMELAELRKGNGNGNGKGKVDDSAVVARLAAMEQKWKRANERAAKEQLKSIAAELNAVSAEQVAALIGGHIKYDDDGNPTIINAEGTPRLNADSKAMGVKELVAEFLSANPHFVKASGTTGAGSVGAKSTGAAGMAKIMKRGVFDSMTPGEKMTFTKAGGTLTD